MVTLLLLCHGGYGVSHTQLFASLSLTHVTRTVTKTQYVCGVAASQDATLQSGPQVLQSWVPRNILESWRRGLSLVVKSNNSRPRPLISLLCQLLAISLGEAFISSV